MILSTEEREERRKLVGFCDHCEEWYNFIDDRENPDVRLHSVCGGRPSAKSGFQLTTQRTFNSKAKKLTKAQLKKMGGVGA
jgi:hypothetical protein